MQLRIDFPRRRAGSVVSIVTELDDRLRRLSDQHLRQLRGTLNSFAVCEPSLVALHTLSKARSVITDLRNGDDFQADVIVQELEHLQRLVQESRASLKIARASDPAWLTLSALSRELALSLDAARSRVSSRTTPEPELAGGLFVPTELFFEAHRTLLPPERMALLSGRVVEGKTTLTALFDVTPFGAVNAGHVRGDGKQLAQALIAMERTGSFLAAWIHSHPWIGPEATRPSPTDRRQYADLVRHYTPDLVGLIIVADGHLRAWGDAVESGRTKLHFIGDGVEPVKEHDHVYRLAR